MDLFLCFSLSLLTNIIGEWDFLIYFIKKSRYYAENGTNGTDTTVVFCQEHADEKCICSHTKLQ